MEDYYNTLLKHLNGYTVMGLFEGKRDIRDIVTLQTGNKGRVFFFDQEPMIRGVDDTLWDYIFREPTIFANSELDSTDKEYVKSRYPNFVDWYFFSHGFVSREWFSAHKHNYAGWNEHKQTVLDCNLVTGSRQYRLYMIAQMYFYHFHQNSFISFNGDSPWREDLTKNDQFGILKKASLVNRIPTEKISYDNWGQTHNLYNKFMQCRIPLEYYNKVNYILVSETLCVENKKHLTEKIFKPIVAGKPFILAGGYKNLEYLRSYGFETFGDLWDESYDAIENPKSRLYRIFRMMKKINLNMLSRYSVGTDAYNRELTQFNEKLKMLEQAHEIAAKNRKYFWSSDFYNQLISEAVRNLDLAKTELASKNI
jgi:hypothetical protein